MATVQEEQPKPISTQPIAFSKSDKFHLPIRRWKLLPLLFIVIVCFLLLIPFYGQVGLWTWLEGLHWCWSLLVFILLFTIVSFPFGFGYVILNMMCGYLYGFVWGQLIVMVSVIIGFSLAFCVCRSLLKEYTRETVNTVSTLKGVLQVIDSPNGFKVIILMRLTPIPFGLQTVLFSVTQVRLVECVLATILGLLPLQLLNTYMGSTVRNMQDVVTDRLNSYLILSGQIVCSMVLMAYLLRKARKELAKHTRDTDIEAGFSNVSV